MLVGSILLEVTIDFTSRLWL